jgi:dienelactone hydrolase
MVGTWVERAAWTYGDPAPGFETIRGTVAFYPGLMDECTLDGELVEAQPGGFYGGWITSEIVGPFKSDRSVIAQDDESHTLPPERPPGL